MIPRRRFDWLLLLLALGTSFPAAADEPATSAVAGWDAFVDGLRTLPDRLLAKLPPDLSGNPQVQQETARLVLESLVVATIEAIGGDRDHPAFLPNQNLVLDLPMPNADTTYRVARMTPGGSYRLRGRLGTLRMLHLSQIGSAARSFIDLNALETDGDGRFDLLVAPARPEGHAGDWWPLLPTADRLLLRMVSSDWNAEQDPTVAIERIDLPPQRPRTAAAVLEQRLRALPQATAALPLLFVDRVARLREEGFVNRMKRIDLAQGGGVTGQTYYDAAYELGDDEALVMEVKLPAECSYFSLILGNEIHETTDWYNNHSSLNDSQAALDADRMLRVVVSARDPGVPNWLDTAGYRRGLLQGRWICDEAVAPPALHKLALADVRRLFPSDTPVVTVAEREATIRQRRLRLQQRPLW